MEGNQMKIREALDAALRFVGNLEIEPYSPLDEEASELRQTIMDALSAPPRNCDVGTAEEQFKRYLAFCHSESRGCKHCRANMTRLRGTSNCDLAWAQMPYAAEEGGAAC